jgi:peptidoglycan/LPS O-acetylase OafA/YrhL
LPTIITALAISEWIGRRFKCAEFDRNSMKRLNELDYLRSLAILIIIYVHIDEFFDKNYWFMLEPYQQSIGPCALALFFFISGFIINNKYPKVDDLKGFFMSRILRLYPLYLIALVFSSIVYWLFPGGEFYPHHTLTDWGLYLSLMQAVFNPTYKWPAMWFMSALAIYYAAYPMIVLKRDLSYQVGTSIVIFLIFFILNITLNSFDSNIGFYFPSFALGIMFLRIRSVNLYSLIATKITSLAEVLLFCSIMYEMVPRSSNRLISFISNSSYAVYLFHQPMLLMIDRSGVSDSILILSVPILFIICNYIQEYEVKFKKDILNRWL